MGAKHRRGGQFRRKGRHAAPSPIDNLAGKASRVAPAVACAGVIAAVPAAHDLTVAKGAAVAAPAVPARLDAAVTAADSKPPGGGGDGELPSWDQLFNEGLVPPDIKRQYPWLRDDHLRYNFMDQLGFADEFEERASSLLNELRNTPGYRVQITYMGVKSSPWPVNVTGHAKDLTRVDVDPRWPASRVDVNPDWNAAGPVLNTEEMQALKAQLDQVGAPTGTAEKIRQYLNDKWNATRLRGEVEEYTRRYLRDHNEDGELREAPAEDPPEASAEAPADARPIPLKITYADEPAADAQSGATDSSAAEPAPQNASPEASGQRSTGAEEQAPAENSSPTDESRPATPAPEETETPVASRGSPAATTATAQDDPAGRAQGDPPADEASSAAKPTTDSSAARPAPEPAATGDDTSTDEAASAAKPDVTTAAEAPSIEDSPEVEEADLGLSLGIPPVDDNAPPGMQAMEDEDGI